MLKGRAFCGTQIMANPFGAWHHFASSMFFEFSVTDGLKAKTNLCSLNRGQPPTGNNKKKKLLLERKVLLLLAALFYNYSHKLVHPVIDFLNNCCKSPQVFNHKNCLLECF